jgi:mannose-6-phosphate isomerase-like protein (cupin superfamily)
MHVKNLAEVPAFITKDGSEIRELLAHRNSAIRHQSLAEARLPVGASTQEHYHPKAEEIYYITQGTGRLRIEGELRDVKPGDAIAIPPGKKHQLWNTGTEILRLLCCCAPGYEHEDTVITEKSGGRALAARTRAREF